MNNASAILAFLASHGHTPVTAPRWLMTAAAAKAAGLKGLATAVQDITVAKAGTTRVGGESRTHTEESRILSLCQLNTCGFYQPPEARPDNREYCLACGCGDEMLKLKRRHKGSHCPKGLW